VDGARDCRARSSSVLVCIAALPAARIFAEPRIEPVLYWLAFGLVVASSRTSAPSIS
jgi:hypothetical protein